MRTKLFSERLNALQICESDEAQGYEVLIISGLR
jgi:hypothetical protein